MRIVCYNRQVQWIWMKKLPSFVQKNNSTEKILYLIWAFLWPPFLRFSVEFEIFPKWRHCIQWQQECIPVGCVPPACWLYPNMYCGGVSAQGGCLSREGVCHPPPPNQRQTPLRLWTDRHLWKLNLRKLRLWAVKINQKDHSSLEPAV